MPDAKKAATLTGAQLRHLLRVTDATSRAPERDRLVLLFDLTCAMRITEIARVLVDDVRCPRGPCAARCRFVLRSRRGGPWLGWVALGRTVGRLALVHGQAAAESHRTLK